MSKILVDTIDTRSGTTTLTLGSSNAGTIALGSGDVQSNFLQPSFRAYLNSAQEVSNNTTTTVAFDGEEFDTDSKYDTSNYRFTPGAGKYFLFTAVRIDETSDFRAELEIRTSEENAICKGVIVNDNTNTAYTYTIATLSATEYAYVTLYQGSGSNATLQTGSGQSYFGGFRIGS